MSSHIDIALIIAAITERRRLVITLEHGLGEIVEIRLDPYIYGEDTYQRSFVWGLNNSLHCYKYYLDWVKAVRLEGGRFKKDKNAVYYYAMEEEHHVRLEDPAIECQVYSHLAGLPEQEVATAILSGKP